MEKLNAKLLIQEAGEKLKGTDSTRLAAMHTGITVAVALVITVLQYILSQGIGNTTGLSGLSTRSILETGQTVLQWANTILVPFWSLGFLYTALRWARGEYARKEDLLAGFRRIGPYLGLLINRFLLSMMVILLCANTSSAIFMMTPAATQITELVASAGSDMNAAYALMEGMSTAQLMDLLYSLIPMLVIWGVLCLVLLVPLMYRFRMAEYVILDHQGARGLSSMFISASLLRRRCWQLFKLDLRLWWYYGLKVLCTILCYADLLLGAMGITLPISGDGAYFVSFGAYLAALFCVETCFRPRVDTAYACAYEQLVAMGPAAKKMPEKPQSMPWDEE